MNTAKVVEMYLSGMYEEDIATKLGVPVITVRTILAQQGMYIGC